MKLLIALHFTEWLTIAYATMGLVQALGYIPQIWTLIVSTGRSLSTPVTTWALWSLEGLVAFLYAIFVLKDLPAIVVIGIDFFAAILILSLVIYNRFFRFKRQSEPLTKSDFSI